MASITATHEKVVQPFDDYQSNAGTDSRTKILPRSVDESLRNKYACENFLKSYTPCNFSYII